ncbi:Gustatory receptor 21b [Halyomorpha halys]|nr:Gustatory receptor 21b [Halyomorpha halys]
MEDALYPVVFMCRIFGVALFTPKFKYVVLYSCYAFLVLIIHIACSGYSIVFLQSMDESLYSSILRLSLDRFQFSIGLFYASLAIVSSFNYRIETLNTLRRLETVDDFLRKNGANLSFNKRRYLFGALFRLALVTIGCSLEHFNQTPIDSWARVIFFNCQFFPLYIANITEYQHNVLLNTIQKRFNSLQEELSSIKKRPSSFSRQAELESLLKLYDRLVQCCGTINEIYGKQILFFVGSIFLMTTANADYVAEGIIELVLDRPSKPIGVLFTFGYWAVLRLVELWSVVDTCEAVVQKAKDFSAALYQFMIDESTESCKNKKIRLHLTVQKEPCFTAYGFFDLDFTLLHSIIAAATTYLVILIQFSQTTTSYPKRVLLNTTASYNSSYSNYTE